MRKLLILFTICSSLCVAQDFETIDGIVRGYPEFGSIDHLSIRLRNDFQSQSERCRAAYTWVANNISYDLQGSKNGDNGKTFYFRDEKDLNLQRAKFKDKLAEEVFNSRRAICQGFSVIFNVLAEKVGLETHYIEGMTKISPQEIGASRSIKDHAWNAVKLNGRWELIDVTWSSGYADQEGVWQPRFNDFFYLTDPEIFINSHFPAEPFWQLLDDELTKESFFNQPVLYLPYFSKGISLMDHVPGIFTPIGKDNTINILFDEFNYKSSLYYQLGETGEIRRLYISKKDDAVWMGTIKIKESKNSILTIYDSENALMDFKIKI